MNAVVEHQKFDIASITAQSLGTAMGQTSGREINAEIKAKRTQTANAYNQAQQDSVGSRQQTSAQGNKVGDNPNSLFYQKKANQGNSSYAGQSKNFGQQHSSHNSSWLTEDPKQRLADVGILFPDNNLASKEVIDTIASKSIDTAGMYSRKYTPVKMSYTIVYV